MRVSMFSKFDMSMYYMNNIQNKGVKQQYQIGTGKKYQQISEDPINANQSLIIEKANKRIEQYQLNIRDLKGSVALTENSLAQTNEILLSVRETALQAANGTASASDKTTFALKIDNNIQQVLSLANQKYLGKYVFSGEMTKTEPFSMVGPSVVYNGNNNPTTIKVSPYMDMNITEDGESVFQTTFDALTNLKTQITLGTPAAIEAAIAQLDAATNDIINKRSNIGIHMDSLELIDENFSSQKVELEIKRINTEEVDFATVISEFANTQRIQQSLMMVTSKMFENSLSNFMR